MLPGSLSSNKCFLFAILACLICESECGWATLFKTLKSGSKDLAKDLGKDLAQDAAVNAIEDALEKGKDTPISVNIPIPLQQQMFCVAKQKIFKGGLCDGMTWKWNTCVSFEEWSRAALFKALMGYLAQEYGWNTSNTSTDQSWVVQNATDLNATFCIELQNTLCGLANRQGQTSCDTKTFCSFMKAYSLSRFPPCKDDCNKRSYCPRIKEYGILSNEIAFNVPDCNPQAFTDCGKKHWYNWSEPPRMCCNDFKMVHSSQMCKGASPTITELSEVTLVFSSHSFVSESSQQLCCSLTDALHSKSLW